VTAPRARMHICTLIFFLRYIVYIRIDGSTCEHDVVIDRGEIRKRKIISLD
jgi:hypothetical protein